MVESAPVSFLSYMVVCLIDCGAGCCFSSVAEYLPMVVRRTRHLLQSPALERRADGRVCGLSCGAGCTESLMLLARAALVDRLGEIRGYAS